jgi:hypothetical protein
MKTSHHMTSTEPNKFDSRMITGHHTTATGKNNCVSTMATSEHKMVVEYAAESLCVSNELDNVTHTTKRCKPTIRRHPQCMGGY